MIQLPPSASRLLTVCTLLAATAATQDAATHWAAFAKLPVGRQQAAAADFLEALPTLPLGDALRTLAAAADAPAKARQKARAAQRAKRTVEFPHEPDPLCRRLDYAFGCGSFEARPGAAKGKAGDPTVLRQALAGLVPDADKALAVLLQRLDTDTGGDAFAVFLHSWRNGDESFYEALDRTAGTKDSVFFYDVMLGDFTTHFGGKGEQRLTGGLQEAHDALHAAFLAYRQYRGFREAVAYSLVLPPDTPLPVRLRRYEEKGPGGYSLRQQVVMVAAALDDDPERVVAAALDGAPPLPQPIWTKAFDPYPAWTARFTTLQPTMIERAGSTDAFLAKAEATRRDLAKGLARLAAERVQQALADHKH